MIEPTIEPAIAPPTAPAPAPVLAAAPATGDLLVEPPSRRSARAPIARTKLLIVAAGALLLLVVIVVAAMRGGGDATSTAASPPEPANQPTPGGKRGEVASADRTEHEAPTDRHTASPPGGAAVGKAEPALAASPGDAGAEPAEPAPVEPELAVEPKPEPTPTPVVARPVRAASTLGGKRVVLEYDSAAPKDPPRRAPVAKKGDDATAIAAARNAYFTGNRKLFAGDSDAAVRLYRHALATYPGYVAGYRGLGLAYAQKGDKANALKALRTYVAAVPAAKDVPLIKKRIATLQR